VVRIHLDTSFLLALLREEAHSGQADAFLRAAKPAPLVSDLAAAEFPSRMARMGEISAPATFDDRMAAAARPLGVGVAEA
jgi:uncharacterized protein with PIN domain